MIYLVNNRVIDCSEMTILKEKDGLFFDSGTNFTMLEIGTQKIRDVVFNDIIEELKSDVTMIDVNELLKVRAVIINPLSFVEKYRELDEYDKLAISFKCEEDFDEFLERAESFGFNINTVTWDDYETDTCVEMTTYHQNLLYASKKRFLLEGYVVQEYKGENNG